MRGSNKSTREVIGPINDDQDITTDSEDRHNDSGDRDEFSNSSSSSLSHPGVTRPSPRPNVTSVTVTALHHAEHILFRPSRSPFAALRTPTFVLQTPSNSQDVRRHPRQLVQR